MQRGQRSRSVSRHLEILPDVLSVWKTDIIHHQCILITPLDFTVSSQAVLNIHKAGHGNRNSSLDCW